jgi:hypothetical protein
VRVTDILYELKNRAYEHACQNPEMVSERMSPEGKSRMKEVPAK